ncbi:MAG: hypothetical protein EOM90_07040 [Alphaproteobacteria bacterium]|nr:hypothetical protein [Alphaproteobacteria bacterium]
MNITKENTGELTALLSIEIVPADYTEKVEKQISDYKRKANIPGFRPGHVPVGLIKKMYGKAILADEVNHLLSESLMNYIRDEKIDILGNPLPNLEKNAAIDFENQDTFKFFFDLGLSPVFDLPQDQDLPIEYLSIAIDDTMVDKYIEETRLRFGKKTEVAEAAVEDPGEGASASAPEPSENTEEKKEPGVIPATMDPDFFNQVYPGMGIQTEEEFRAQVKKDASSSFDNESDKLLFNVITEALVNHTTLTLPDEFLKRWLAENNEGKYTPEQIEKEYPLFAESMKWQLIENKIIKDNGITVTDPEIRDYIRTVMLRQVPGAEPSPEMQQQYESIIDVFMKNKEQVQRINDQLYNAKMLNFFKQTFKYTTREVTYDEFIKIASQHHNREHTHSHNDMHDHDHDHDYDHDHESVEEKEQ